MQSIHMNGLLSRWTEENIKALRAKEHMTNLKEKKIPCFHRLSFHSFPHLTSLFSFPSSFYHLLVSFLYPCSFLNLICHLFIYFLTDSSESSYLFHSTRVMFFLFSLHYCLHSFLSSYNGSSQACKRELQLKKFLKHTF